MKVPGTMIQLTQTQQWQALQQHYQAMMHVHMRNLFLENPKRCERFYLEAAGLCLDYSKNRITTDTMELLFSLATSREVASQIEALFTGNFVNFTENHPALHTALRNLSGKPIYVNKANVMLKIAATWDKMATFINTIYADNYKGFSGKPIRDIVNIGIGGSDLGPLMAYHALEPYARKKLRFHFISNQDEFHILETLKKMNPSTTLFIVTSKSFTSKETIDNANIAKQWLMSAVGDEELVKKHFVAVTAQPNKACEYGILPEAIFPLWEWVGGRYSIWSAVGLSVAIAIGMDNFKDFLAGAYAMDQHFRSAEFPRNMPVILALLTIWYNNFFCTQSRAIIPYSQQLLYFPDYLKQLHMESQGKTIQRDGKPVDYATGCIVWGGVGSNSQHSFHQLFLQGNQLAPIDFILPLKNYCSNCYQYELIANCLSQSETLMRGYNLQEVLQDLREQNIDEKEANFLAKHKTIMGNYPSNTILLEKITPYTLGALLALYEHKVYVQSLIWNINAFDQWGVERGKKMAKTILQDLKQGRVNKNYDASTQMLMAKVLQSNIKRQQHVK